MKVLHEREARLARLDEALCFDLKDRLGITAGEIPRDVVAERFIEGGVELAGRTRQPKRSFLSVSPYRAVLLNPV